MTRWCAFKIGELGRVVTGRTPSSSEPEMFLGEVPFLTPTEIDGESRFVETKRVLSRAWDPKGKIRLPPGSVCVVCIGATIGKICMTRQISHTNQQINSIIVDEERFDPLFIYYALKLKIPELKSRAAGAATPILNKTAFSEIELEVPGLTEQTRVASILGAYDDLIEVNQRRATVLEGMARGLFEEWFIHFRFPGHDTVVINETPDGPLPDGWRWGTISDVARQTGTSISPGSTPERVFAHYSLPAFDASKSPVFEAGGSIMSNKLLFEAPAVLVSKLNPRIPRIWHVLDDHPEPQIASTEFVPLVPIEPLSSALLCTYVSAPEFSDRLRGMAGGTSTSHQRVRPSDIMSTPIVVPPSDLLALIDRNIRPLYDLINNLQAASRALAASRDLLLPRLASSNQVVMTTSQKLEGIG